MSRCSCEAAGEFERKRFRVARSSFRENPWLLIDRMHAEGCEERNTWHETSAKAMAYASYLAT